MNPVGYRPQSKRLLEQLRFSQNPIAKRSNFRSNGVPVYSTPRSGATGGPRPKPWAHRARLARPRANCFGPACCEPRRKRANIGVAFLGYLFGEAKR